MSGSFHLVQGCQRTEQGGGHLVLCLLSTLASTQMSLTHLASDHRSVLISGVVSSSELQGLLSPVHSSCPLGHKQILDFVE